jgi:SAM-dependent methyltransferase
MNPEKTYATFGVMRSFRQVMHAVRERGEAGRNMSLLYSMVKQNEALIEQALGRPVCDLNILEVGTGQGMERARYFGIQNKVTGMDLDVIPQGMDASAYLQLIRKNGFGRFFKTVGRRLIIAGPNREGWVKATGVQQLKDPEIFYGDICKTVPAEGAFDLALSWSVFEHLSDPRAALLNMMRALKPGGVLFISLHLYTANNGHHDIRAFTGQEASLPLWGHLRESTRHLINPSSYLNEWRLDQWRALFNDVVPGWQEVLDMKNGYYQAQMRDEIRQELQDYTDEELFTVDTIMIWKKPASGPRVEQAASGTI